MGDCTRWRFRAATEPEAEALEAGRLAGGADPGLSAGSEGTTGLRMEGPLLAFGAEDTASRGVGALTGDLEGSAVGPTGGGARTGLVDCAWGALGMGGALGPAMDALVSGGVGSDTLGLLASPGPAGASFAFRFRLLSRRPSVSMICVRTCVADPTALHQHHNHLRGKCNARSFVFVFPLRAQRTRPRAVLAQRTTSGYMGWASGALRNWGPGHEVQPAAQRPYSAGVLRSR